MPRALGDSFGTFERIARSLSPVREHTNTAAVPRRRAGRPELCRSLERDDRQVSPPGVVANFEVDLDTGLPAN